MVSLVYSLQEKLRSERWRINPFLGPRDRVMFSFDQMLSATACHTDDRHTELAAPVHQSFIVAGFMEGPTSTANDLSDDFEPAEVKQAMRS